MSNTSRSWDNKSPNKNILLSQAPNKDAGEGANTMKQGDVKIS